MKDNKRLSDLAEGQTASPPTAKSFEAFYGNLEEIYSPSDHWHQITHEWVTEFVRSNLPIEPSGMGLPSVLNLGSGGEAHGIPEECLLHVDLVPNAFSPGQRFILDDIQHLQPQAKPFDVCLCVGSVLNHCDASLVIQSAGRLLRPGGTLFLEFETSRSLELLFSRQYGRSAAIVDTFYQGQTVRLWAYDEIHIQRILEVEGLRVEKRASKHHLSPLVYGLCRQPNWASRFHVLDPVARRLPWLNRACSNVIYLCTKAPE